MRGETSANVPRPGRDVGEVLKALPSNRPLRVTRLELCDWSLREDDPCRLGSLIVRCPSLTRLSLARNWLTDAAVYTLSGCIKFIQENGGARLRELDLSENLLSAEGCEMISASFFPDISGVEQPLKTRVPYMLDLSLNDIGDRGASALAAALAPRECFAQVRLRNACVGSGGIAALAVAGPYLMELDLSGNAVCSVGLEALCAGLIRRAPALHTLDLSHIIVQPCLGRDASNSSSASPYPHAEDTPETDFLSERLAQLLIPVLKCSETRLRRLGLAGNGLDGQAAQRLLEALLRGGSSLNELDLDSNHIGATWKGTELRPLVELLEVRQPKDGLKVLRLCDNALDDFAAALLAEGVRRGVALETLTLTRNVIGDRGAASLADALKAQRLRLAELDLDLSDALNCRGVQQLRLDLNPIGDVGLEALAESASTVPTLDAPQGPWGLTELWIAGHHASARGLAALRQAVTARQGLLTLLLKSLSGAEPPKVGAGPPPPMLRVDELQPPSFEDAAVEAHVARHWEEHLEKLDGGNCSGSTETIVVDLDEELRAFASECEASARSKERHVFMAHLPCSEDPELEAEVPEGCDESGMDWWARVRARSVGALSGYQDNAPDALDAFWGTDENGHGSQSDECP